MAVIARAIRSHRGFEHMYRRHVPSIYRYTLAVLGNEAPPSGARAPPPSALGDGVSIDARLDASLDLGVQVLHRTGSDTRGRTRSSPVCR